jgi:hypothetical protein
MAEEVPEYDLMKPGHRFDTDPLLLDLYRLLTMVLGDKHLAEMEEESFTIQTLRGQYVYSELIRILTSTSIALRILFDQHEELLGEVSKRPCGRLFSDWPKREPEEDLTLREACNKIIHAKKVHYNVVDPDPGYNPDQIGVYLRPYLHLYGARDGRDWKADLSIIDFGRQAAAALVRFPY